MQKTIKYLLLYFLFNLTSIICVPNLINQNFSQCWGYLNEFNWITYFWHIRNDVETVVICCQSISKIHIWIEWSLARIYSFFNSLNFPNGWVFLKIEAFFHIFISKIYDLIRKAIVKYNCVFDYIFHFRIHERENCYKNY
jgi:hypothetical protein